MKKGEVIAIKNRAIDRKGKASDLDVLVSEVIKLPPGQLKKVLTEPVLEVLRKYGYTEE